MTINTNETKATEPKNPLIDLADARHRAKSWLRFMRTLVIFRKQPKKMPRALYIGVDDFTAMIEECKKNYANYDVRGVRIYFGLKPNIEDTANSAGSLCGMMVPVLHKKGTKDAEGFDGNPSYLAVDDPNYTGIYDFTSTCPDYCDTASELYVPIPTN